MHLFLQGPIGIGKSTLLRQALAPVEALVSGLVTQRLRQNGSVAGYRALVVRGALPPLETYHLPGQEGIFLLKGWRDISVLEKALAQAERAALDPQCKLILLDEIGGVELKSPVFMQALERMLNSGKPCLGVVKAAQNLAHTVAKHSLGEEYLILHQELAALIRAQGELLTVSAANRGELLERLNCYVQAQVNLN